MSAGKRIELATIVFTAVAVAVVAVLLAGAPSASANGASLVLDMVAGSGSSDPCYGDYGYGDDACKGPIPTDVGGTLYFTADDGVHGLELWRSDGTATGTTLVSDINPGSADSLPDELTNVGGTLFFVADDGLHGAQVWRSDGTPAGTSIVSDFYRGRTDGLPHHLTSVGETIFFAAADEERGVELWRSDGTPAGTTLVRDIRPGGRGSRPYDLTDVGGRLFFVARQGRHGGYELWRSNGTRMGTKLLRAIGPERGARWYSYSSPRKLTSAGGKLFFIAWDDSHGGELWRSNGTRRGTKLVRDIKPGPGGFDRIYPPEPTSVGKTLYFTAADGRHGSELWRSNGTRKGTKMVRDIRPGRGIPGSSYPQWLTDVAGTLFFTAKHGTRGFDFELWRSNGTQKGTKFIRDIRPGRKASYPEELASVGNTLFFNADDGTHGRELWRSNGTREGTVLVRDIRPGRLDSKPFWLTNVNRTLFFRASDDIHGNELWKAAPNH